jgi:5'-methylthioadenosine phosphorylase
MISAATELGLRIHHTGTIITIEGNRFSTKSESNMFRIWGADIINMSITPEVILANEAVIPYACIAISTDYDCWRERESWVTWKKVLQVFEANLEKVKKLLIETIKKPEFFQ